MEPFVFALAASLFLSLTLTPICGRLAKRTGYLDHPAGHKAHANATPLLGGLAMVLAILLPAAVAAAMLRYDGGGLFQRFPLRLDALSLLKKLPQAYVIFSGLVGLHLLGLIDDRRGMGPWLKLVVQILVAAFTVLCGRIAILEMFGPVASAILTTLWLVVLMNSFNFLDNADGLTTGVGAVCAAALLACALAGGQGIVAVLPALLLGALLGFLPYNFNPAKIFMGDAGSLPVGYLLGVSSCMITYTTGLERTADVLLGGAIAPLLIMAVPLYDTASVMIIRIREGRNPMVGDNRHFSHRLRERGMSVRQAVLTIYLCTAATAIAGVILPHAVGFLPPILLLSQSLLILLIIALLESPRKV